MPTSRWFYFLFLLEITVLLPAQTTRFAAVDAQAQNTNAGADETVDALAHRLFPNGSTPTQKARAAYTWLTTHVAYNDTAVTRGWLGTWQNAVQQQPENVLRSRLAVCEGYANLMQSLCEAGGLRAAVVSGQVKDADGYVPEIGHAWVAVEAEGKWLLCDPTWGAGYTDARSRRFVSRPTDEWFGTPALQFLATHLPDDPVWQFSATPVTVRQFLSLGAGELTRAAAMPTDAPFAFLDTIEQWFALDSVDRVLASSRRVLQLNPDNDFALYHLGVYYYNLALRAYFDLSHEIAEQAYQPDAHPDSTALLRRIAASEAHYRRAWEYFRYVHDGTLKNRINHLPTPEEESSNYHYLRGMVRLWLVRALSTDFPLENAALFEARMPRIRAQAQLGRNSFAAALDKIDPKNLDLEFVWNNNLSLLLYEWAQAERSYAASRPVLDEKQIRAQLDALDRAEILLDDMKAAVQRALAHHLPPAQGTVADDYYGSKALIQSERGALNLEQVQLKNRSVLGPPLRVSLDQANEMVNELEKCAEHYSEALRWAAQEPDADHAGRLRTSILNRNGHCNALMGDLLNSGAIQDYNAALSKPAALSARKPFLRSACEKAAQHYNHALACYEKAGAEAALLRQLKERMKGLQEFQAALR